MRNLTRRELLFLSGCGALARPRIALPSPRSIENNPFEGKQLYVDPDAQAAQWVRANERTRPDDAALMRKIAESWCNPPGRALGDRPREGPAPADALLWIKPPGDSDETCRQGPAAGRFWPEYAVPLARRARW